jgi:hypothetical protein
MKSIINYLCGRCYVVTAIDYGQVRVCNVHYSLKKAHRERRRLSRVYGVGNVSLASRRKIL